MHFITPDGMFNSEEPAEVPESYPYDFQSQSGSGDSATGGHEYVDPYVNLDTWQHQWASAGQPGNLWQMIKFAGQRAVAAYQATIPMAEWPAFGRGRNIDWWQSPTVVSLQAGQHGWLDRFGPYKHPVLSQQLLDQYLSGALPAEVFAIEQATAK